MNAQLVLAQLYWKKTDPREGTTILIVLGVLVGLLLVYQIVKQLGSGKGGLSGGAGSFSRGAFRRAAREGGLAEEELRFLEEYGKVFRITNPEFLFKNKAKLDGFFKEAYRYIEKNSESEPAAEERKARLFAIRERLAKREALGAPVTSTRQLGRGVPLSFIAPGGENYPSVIVAVEPGGLAVEPARDPYGEAIRFRKGSKLTCYFYTKGHQGFQFQARVAGWERIGPREVMVLAHSEAVTALPARSHVRREIRVPCTYYRVAVTTTRQRGKEKSNAKVEKIPFPGTIVDISAGGLGIQCASPIDAGDFLKIEFNPGGGSQAAFGKVVRMNRLKGTGGVMHIQFVKISQRGLNAILSYVYGYGE